MSQIQRVQRFYDTGTGKARVIIRIATYNENKTLKVGDKIDYSNGFIIEHINTDDEVLTIKRDNTVYKLYLKTEFSWKNDDIESRSSGYYRDFTPKKLEKIA